jgi:hypothetical protein
MGEGEQWSCCFYINPNFPKTTPCLFYSEGLNNERPFCFSWFIDTN